MSQERNFTEGKILSPLIRFMLPVFLAMFLQAMYGAVDLLIVGKFASLVDVSMFHIGLATPCSTIIQVILCLIWFRMQNRKYAETESTEIAV